MTVKIPIFAGAYLEEHKEEHLFWPFHLQKVSVPAFAINKIDILTKTILKLLALGIKEDLIIDKLQIDRSIIYKIKLFAETNQLIKVIENGRIEYKTELLEEFDHAWDKTKYNKGWIIFDAKYHKVFPVFFEEVALKEVDVNENDVVKFKINEVDDHIQNRIFKALEIYNKNQSDDQTENDDNSQNEIIFENPFEQKDISSKSITSFAELLDSRLLCYLPINKKNKDMLLTKENGNKTIIYNFRNIMISEVSGYMQSFSGSDTQQGTSWRYKKEALDSLKEKIKDGVNKNSFREFSKQARLLADEYMLYLAQEKFKGSVNVKSIEHLQVLISSNEFINKTLLNLGENKMTDYIEKQNMDFYHCLISFITVYDKYKNDYSYKTACSSIHILKSIFDKNHDSHHAYFNYRYPGDAEAFSMKNMAIEYFSKI